MTSPALKSSEPILGYQVIERIGAGGYGEVWKAIAPGGLAKAIKFVYGYHDEVRASRELKALAAIKEVRHPFLLSLERFEVVDGQLIIVTELAEKSLKDRHDECKASGLVGIPRDELLGYLRDAADALDYMRQRFELQHLDVKPENLLLVGGRVKVADFGLVKSIGDDKTSMNGGLTALYAAPELFNDQPSEFSDQYSLAIVYQELLSDTLPFAGKSTAQLAAQHLQARARFTALPQADKPLLDRALAKIPQRRFPSCRAMIDALVAAGQPATASPTTATVQPPAEPIRDTQPIAPSATRVVSEKQLQRLPRTQAPCDTVDLPPLGVPPGPHLRPTLVLGIGGTATMALAALRGRLADQFGSLDAIPAIRLLLVDTDVAALRNAAETESETAFPPRDVLAAALKKTDEYRTDSPRLLQWLNRRWLYNMPRSLRTEGLRPLGRLALVDHAPAILERVRSVLAAITDAAAIAATAQSTGQPMADASPRVVIVASISGGTGSGMALDMAYAARKLLGERGLADDGVTLVLLHSTSHNPAARDLATANAYAFLTELDYYLACGYAGEPECELPTLTAAASRLPRTYLIHLGDNLNDGRLRESADDVAEYLHLSIATAAANWFDEARRSTPTANTPADATNLRTFGLCRLGCSRRAIAAMVDQVCRAVVDHWIGGKGRAADSARSFRDGSAGSTEAHADRTARQHLDRLALSADNIVVGLHQAVEAALGRPVDSHVRQLVSKALTDHAAVARGEASEAAARELPAVLAEIDAALAPGGRAETGPGQVSFSAAMRSQVQNLAKEHVVALKAWAVALADTPELRLPGAARSIEIVAHHLRGIRSASGAMREQAVEQLREIVQWLGNVRSRGRGWSGRTTGETSADFEARLVQYGQLKVLETALGSVVQFVELLLASVKTVNDGLAETRQQLAKLVETFDAEPRAFQSESLPRAEATIGIELAAVKMIETSMPELVVRLDQQFQDEFIRHHGGLCAAVDQGNEFCEALHGTLRGCARAAVLKTIRAASVETKVREQDSSGTGGSSALRACLSEANPLMSGCGGAQRLVVIAADQRDAETLAAAIREQVRQSPSIAVATTGEPVVCYEVAQLPLANAAAMLAEGHPDCARIAERLHTRADVAWHEFHGAKHE